MITPGSPPTGAGTPDVGSRAALSDPLDYSTPEAQEALRVAAGLLLEVRKYTNGPLVRKVRLYELTFGLAVVPILIRRMLYRLRDRWRVRRPTN